jgi:hypothetical protein
MRFLGEGLEFKVIEKHAAIKAIEYTLEREGRTVYALVSSQISNIESDSVKILPKWKECLQIPL